MLTRRLPVIVVATVGALFAAGCSSDSEGATTTQSTVVELSTTTTEAPSTTVPPSTSEAAPTTTIPGPTYPLTGLPILNPGAENRPAMVVKIDNFPDARPQSGLNEADIVYEENVEGVTRFAAVFHSNGADPVGPIRSGRTQDIALLGSLNKPLYVWSGGNRKVADAILKSDLQQISENSGAMFRDHQRDSPHNLYANMSELYKLAPADASAPPPQFTYRDADTAAAGEDIAGVKLTMDGGLKARWDWDKASAKFLRFTDEKVHKDTVFDAQVSADNVVVLFVDYRPSPADSRSPEAQTLGTGQVWAYSDGKLVSGTWTREDRLQPFTLTADDGSPIELTPGRTWVELARDDSAVTVEAGTDPATVRYPSP